MSLYLKSAPLAPKILLKSVLCLDSPTLIALRPICQTCQERLARFASFCRECRPHQTEDDADLMTLRAQFQENCGIRPMSLADAQAVPFVIPEGEIAAREANHFELLAVQRQIDQLTADENALLEECCSLDFYGFATEAQALYHDAHVCHLERADLLNRYGAELELPLPELFTQGESA